MGKVIISNRTVKDPITLIGEEAGICYGANVFDPERNYKRGLDCLESNHGRTLEFPDVYITIEGYSARVMREWYTHIGGTPTRLQASTRYINYQKGFDYITPPSIANHERANTIYTNLMDDITFALQALEDLGIPKEDSANCLPLGMETVVACKHNLRNLLDMSHQRECVRAYWEYREVFQDLKDALSEYSPQWKYIVDNYFMPKCELYGRCTETHGCGRY